MDVDVGRIAGLAHAPTGVLAIGYLVVPGLAAIIGPPLLSERLFLGLFVVLAGPATVGGAIAWTRIDGGDAALTSAIAILSVALSPVVVPALFAGLLSTSVSLEPVAIGTDLLTVLAGGVLLELLVPDELIGERALDRVIATLVYVAVGTAGLSGAGVDDVLVIVVAVLLVDVVVVGSATVGGRVLGLPRAPRRSVVFGAGLKSRDRTPRGVVRARRAGPADRALLRRPAVPRLDPGRDVRPHGAIVGRVAGILTVGAGP